MTGPLVVACAALASDLRAVLDEQGLSDAVEVRYLPAPLHNRPERIVPALREQLADVERGRTVLIGYADCGTGGMLDDFLAELEVEFAAAGGAVSRIPGNHCYEFFAGSERFAALHDAEPGTFYLTDFLAKHFDALVWQGLGLARAPVAARHVLRQLHAGGAAVAGRRPGRARRRASTPPSSSGSRSSTCTSAREQFAAAVQVGVRGRH